MAKVTEQAFITRVNDLFQRRAIFYLEELKASFDAKDMLKVAFEAHRFASEAFSIGSAELGTELRKIEADARSNVLTDVDFALLERLTTSSVYEAAKTSTSKRLDRLEESVVGVTTSVEVLSNNLLALEARMNDTAQEVKSGIVHLTSVVETQMKNLVDCLTGVDRVPSEIMNKIVTIMGLVIVGLLFALVFVLTGQKFQLLPKF